MCIFVYTAQQNPMLVTRNDAGLGVVENIQVFKKHVLIAVCLDGVTSALPQILKQSLKTSKESFYKYI